MENSENRTITIKKAFQELLSDDKKDMSAFGLTYFSMSVSAVMLKYIDYIMSMKQEKKAGYEDYIKFLNGDEMFEHIDMFKNMNRFFEWLLKEKAGTTDTEDLSQWYDISFICRKWDEYVTLTRE